MRGATKLPSKQFSRRFLLHESYNTQLHNKSGTDDFQIRLVLNGNLTQKFQPRIVNNYKLFKGWLSFKIFKFSIFFSFNFLKQQYVKNIVFKYYYDPSTRTDSIGHERQRCQSQRCAFKWTTQRSALIQTPFFPDRGIETLRQVYSKTAKPIYFKFAAFESKHFLKGFILTKYETLLY